MNISSLTKKGICNVVLLFLYLNITNSIAQQVTSPDSVYLVEGYTNNVFTIKWNTNLTLGDAVFVIHHNAGLRPPTIHLWRQDNREYISMKSLQEANVYNQKLYPNDVIVLESIDQSRKNIIEQLPLIKDALEHRMVSQKIDVSTKNNATTKSEKTSSNIIPVTQTQTPLVSQPASILTKKPSSYVWIAWFVGSVLVLIIVIGIIQRK